MAEQLEKSPPQAVDAERSVLGAMILYPDLTERGLELLGSDMFYTKAHGTIFNRIEQLITAGSSANSVTLSEALERHGELEQAGGADYIVNLVNSVISSAHFDEHANLVEEKALLRKIVQLSTSVIDRAYRAPGDIREFVDNVEAEFYKISERRLRGDFVHIKSVLNDVHEEVMLLQQQQKSTTGTSTGYSDLDKYLTGFHPSDYVVLAGRTSTGKTAFALSLAKNIAIERDDNERRGVAIFSLEMSKQQVVMRLLASVARINAHHMRQGYLTTQELNQLRIKLDRISSAPIYIDDTPNLTVMEMRTKARRLARQNNISVIIVDYMQLVMPSTRRSDSRQEDVASISRALKALAREMSVTVIALAQLSRRVEEAGDKRPRLSHLRESGAIEQDADIVLLLYRPEVHNMERAILRGKEFREDQLKGLSSLIIAKQRNGPTGEVLFAFDRESISFGAYETMISEEDYAGASATIDEYEDYSGP